MKSMRVTVQTAVIITDEEMEEFVTTAEGDVYFAIDYSDTAYIVFPSEDGEWRATRAPAERDRAADGTFPGGVTVLFESLVLPIRIQESWAEQ